MPWGAFHVGPSIRQATDGARECKGEEKQSTVSSHLSIRNAIELDPLPHLSGNARLVTRTPQ